jgi:ribosomal protein L11 methyltransferase
MVWRELIVQPVPRGLVSSISRALFKIGAAGIQEDHTPGTAPPPRQPWDVGPPPPVAREVVLRAWFEDPDEPSIASQVLSAAAPNSSCSWHAVVEQDWSTSWQDSFQPIHISERLIIAPPWDNTPGTIRIEPGQGFGTGQHETTQGALRAIDQICQAQEIGSALDIGCGSGILALTTAHFGIRSRGIDVDTDAIQNARHNATLNQLDVLFDTTTIADLTEPADLTMANLFAEALVEMSSHLIRLSRHHLVLAGILADREHMVRDIFDAAMGCPQRQVDGEWICLHYTVPSLSA